MDNIYLWTLIIFLARVCDVGLGTVRVQFIIRSKKLLAAVIGFVEVLIFILIVSRVIQDIHHWPYVLAYAGGFATGTLLGMALTERFTQRLVQATVICNGSLESLETALRDAGFAMTRYQGIGRDGPVNVIDVICSSKGLSRLSGVVNRVEPDAFLYTHELIGLRGGYVYGLKSKV